MHLIQTSIQALIDLGSHLVARLALQTPRTRLDIFERLETSGHLPAGTTTEMAPIIGFRNRVDEPIVYDILTRHRSDLVRLFDRLLSVKEALDADDRA